jgi:hypothetical protein
MKHVFPWTFLPPPGATFQLHTRGLLIVFQKGLEAHVEKWLRDWIGVYEDSSRRNTFPGALGGRQFPKWIKPEHPLGIGVVEWVLKFPDDIRVWMAPGTDMGGRIMVGLEQGIPGSISVVVPPGREVDVGECFHESLDKACGRTREMPFNPPPKPPPVPPPVARGLRHLAPAVRLAMNGPNMGLQAAIAASPDLVPSEVPTSVASPQGARSQLSKEVAKAKGIADDFFAKLSEDIEAGAVDDTEPPPPNTPRNDAPDGTAPVPKAPAALPRPMCTCPPAIRGSGAHGEGCPAENYPPGFFDIPQDG